MSNNQTTQYRIRVNYNIRVPQVRVVLEDGSSPGIMNTPEALKMAQELGLDLIEINPKTAPPICKIMDFGKHKYSEKKKATEAKKNQKVQEMKELSFRPGTEEHDLLIKLNAAKQFLTDGHKVRFVCKFRGREMSHPEIGREKLSWILQQLNGLIGSSPDISMEGKWMSVIVSPARQKQ
jgi:translation initiation factor IF-3